MWRLPRAGPVICFSVLSQQKQRFDKAAYRALECQGNVGSASSEQTRILTISGHWHGSQATAQSDPLLCHPAVQLASAKIEHLCLDHLVWTDVEKCAALQQGKLPLIPIPARYATYQGISGETQYARPRKDPSRHSWRPGHQGSSCHRP